MTRHPLLRALAAWAAVALLLAGCGGGGGGGGSRFGASSQFEEGVAGCTLETQKRFVRSYMDEVYLWYNEIPDVDAASYSNIPDYFNALRVRTPDANGVPKDRFSDVLPIDEVQALLRQTDALQQDAGPLLKAGTGSFVPEVFTGATPDNHGFGYIQFNNHAIGAQDQLIAAFRQMRDAGVRHLVLDLRANSGGFLYIAQAAASMIAGPASSGQVFERLRYNAKREAESRASTLSFTSTVLVAEPGSPVRTELPQLGLTRVFVLTTGRTCSASESIINSLQGIGVDVVRVGTTTCGKPYGFRQKNNCGLAFFPIEFQGSNAKGFGDYTTGIAPTCQVESAGTPGGSDDTLLAAAKHYIDKGECPSVAASSVQSAATPIVRDETPALPAWAGRLLLPGQR